MRLILDFDNRSRKWTCNKKLSLVRRMFPKNRIEFEKSAWRKGFHIIVYKATSDFEELIMMRNAIGDDAKRIYYDCRLKSENRPWNVCFDKKGDKYIENYGEI